MNRLQRLQAQLRAKIAEANSAAEKALAAAEADKRALTAEEKAAQDAFNSEIQGLRDMIALEEAQASRQGMMAGHTTPVSTTQVLDAGHIGASGAGANPRIEIGAANITRDPQRGYPTLAHFALDVHQASHQMGGATMASRRLVEAGLMGATQALAAAQAAAMSSTPMAAPTNFMQETGTVEGAMVPPSYSTNIWTLVFQDPLLDMLTIEPTSASAVGLFADETTPWGATGILAKWRSEATRMDPSKLVTNERMVKLHELYAFALATEELLEDLPRLNDRLAVKAPAAIRWKLIETFMFGSGAGMPLGWAADGYAGKVDVPRAGAGAIGIPDISKLFSRMLVLDGQDRTFFVCNRDTLPQFIGLVIGNQPVWLPSNGMAGQPNGTVLGRPLFFSEHCETLGTKGDLQYVNPAGYYAAQRGQARLDASIHLYFDYAISAFRWMFRFGGQPYLSAPVGPAKGDKTKSFFAILADAA